MASAADPQGKLDSIVRAIAANMSAEVSSIYVRLPTGALELYATEGLRREAVRQLKMAKGEGLVGLIAEMGEPVNLPDAQKHKAFSYKPETGEEAFHSFLGVPILRDHRTLGVLTVQNKIPRKYGEEEVEALQTTAMVLAEMFSSGTFAGTAAPSADRRGSSITIKGAAMADGLALGHIVLHEPRPEIVKFFGDNVVEETHRLDQALEQLKATIEEMAARKAAQGGGEQQELLETLKMMAASKSWARNMRDAVVAGLTAEAAVDRVQQNMRTQLMRGGEAVWRERIDDLDDLSNRLLRILNGTDGDASAKLPTDAIIVAKTMGAAELMDYEKARPRGLILEGGGDTSHVGIVARSLNLAAVMQAKDILGWVNHGDPAILDAETGEVHIRPSLELLRAYADKARFRARRLKRFSRLRTMPPITRDGHRITVNMNAGLIVDVSHLAQSGADGIGLFRTELQFMIASKFPKMSEQRDTYARVLDGAEGRRVVFRAVDIGGDKVLPYMRNIPEANPALGWRAIRMALDRPGMFRTQVRALLHAAAGRELSLMLPFVADVAEIASAREWIEREMERAKRLNHAVPAKVRVGVMLEVPALAYQMETLLPLVDFVSVGSNDLFQFFFAADRENDRVARRFDVLSTPALKLLRDIAAHAKAHNVDCSLCGEMAGRPLEALALIALGYKSISMAPASIGPVKAMIVSTPLAEAQSFLAECLERPGATIRKDLTEFARQHRIDI
jgi:phosphotransferase system enzyme I (PtsP)